MSARYKQTLFAFGVFIILVLIGTIVFSALEPDMPYSVSFQLTMQIVTTVGYGNHPPKTNSGKIFCIFFSVIGISANLFYLQKVGEHMMNWQKFVISKIEMKIFKISEPKYLYEKNLVLCGINLVLLVMIGAAFEVYSSDWSFLDGVYCYSMTFTTIGFGDFVPGFQAGSRESVHYYSRFVLPVVNLFGLCAMSTTINCFLECSIPDRVMNRIRHKKAVTTPEENNQVGEMTM